MPGNRSPKAGGRDFGNNATPSSGDLNELANRINAGAGGLFRTGNWVFYESFDDAVGLARWDATATGGGTNELSATKIYRGLQSLHWLTGAVLNNQCAIQRAFPVSPANKLGVEFMFRPQTQGNWELRFIITQYYFRLNSPLGVGNHTARVYITKGDDITVLDETVTVYHPTGSEAAGSLPRITGGFWYNIKLTFDPSAVGPQGGFGAYGKIMVNNHSLDISGYSMQQAFTVPPEPTDMQYTNFMIVLVTKEAAAKECYIDDLIITNSEP